MNIKTITTVDGVNEVDFGSAAISGEKYINLAIWHGTESNSYTTYLYVDRVEFIYG